PALHPRSKDGTRQARYSVDGSRRRGHSRRETVSAGSPARAEVSAAAFRALPVTWAWAHAHDSARSGSSRPGRAGAAIPSTGRLTATETTPAWLAPRVSVVWMPAAAPWRVHGRNT